MNLQHRSYQTELLDQDDIPFKDIASNMQELNTINKWLGGHAITLKGFKQFLTNAPVTVCEIGCGGGDNIAALRKWCIGNNINATFTGVDIKQECIEYAKSRQPSANDITWVVSDYRTMMLDSKPDIIFSSLFCHHFAEDDVAEQMRWMKKNCTKGFFINDLQRHTLAYYSIRVLTSLFSSSYLVKNDAPLSVARAFTRNEWQAILRKAGVGNATISWQWAFRYLICFHHAQK